MLALFTLAPCGNPGEWWEGAGGGVRESVSQSTRSQTILAAEPLAQLARDIADQSKKVWRLGAQERGVIADGMGVHPDPMLPDDIRCDKWCRVDERVVSKPAQLLGAAARVRNLFAPGLGQRHCPVGKAPPADEGGVWLK